MVRLASPPQTVTNRSPLLQSFAPIAAVATTPQAIQALKPLWESGEVTLYVPSELAAETDSPFVKSYGESLREMLPTLWQTHQGFVFYLAIGAVVRLIAPLLQDKTRDPAVVVVDGANHVISLSGGHQGGADCLTRTIAALLGAEPILTGGANELDLPGVDVLGLPFGWRKGNGNWTGVSAAVARLGRVQVIQEAGSTLWQQHLPMGHPFLFSEEIEERPDGRIWISPLQRRFSPEADYPKVQWHPRVLWVGVGCERGTSRQLIEFAIQEVCRSAHLAEDAIAGIATIDIKSDEAGILELCRDRQWALKCFTAEELRSIEVPTPSEVVEVEVGTPSVSEAAAICASQIFSDFSNSMDSADSSPIDRLRVSKKIVRQEGQPGAVTVAIAQAEREYTGRTGQLWLVGIGPGELNQITPAAQAAISQADAVIGYSLYMDLVRSLLRPGQIVETLPITQERQRAERAIDLANWGLTVAVISSGDCGIYGMAGLVLEQLRSIGWNGKTPDVRVFPGITALQSVASRVGAPLMHDFCAISLSDLLTPWQVIEQRLAAAAQADFVTALYNPRSQSRTQQMAIAQQILLQYRAPETPVAIVRSVYRPEEQIRLTTLGELDVETIDMLTTVLIGNRSTRLHEHWMITPRGYLGFGEAEPSSNPQVNPQIDPQT
ncbi:precorrin-3B C(17)-methyltransferase [Leptolyngbya ohadii]|uniref:precorrin-3B C(17)-methyltransferase n=1 Tax=Leptolyngbya ohadii TaxID=1962290 RepID=UPI000B599A7C|nr:precorrin-3B C(17)-methyltransferase [Leptolyngbya ohadii]